mgnify:CR=1 FL=1
MLEGNTDNEMYISEMIRFTHGLGVTCINFHDIFKGEIPLDFWIGQLDISIDEWLQTWEELQKNIEKNIYPIGTIIM